MTDYGLSDADVGLVIYEKTPDEAIVVRFYWAARLDGETISSATYELPDGLTNEADSESGSIAQVRVSGGSEGYTYRVISKITTSGTRDLEAVKRVVVREG